jgi:hypothetical protein
MANRTTETVALRVRYDSTLSVGHTISLVVSIGDVKYPALANPTAPLIGGLRWGCLRHITRHARDKSVARGRTA